MNGRVQQEIAGDIQYDTFGGADHPRPIPEINVIITGDRWPAPKVN
jgi:hypothetical protein